MDREERDRDRVENKLWFCTLRKEKKKSFIKKGKKSWLKKKSLHYTSTRKNTVMGQKAKLNIADYLFSDGYCKSIELTIL